MEQDMEKWYEDQFNLFSSPGWKDFVAKTQEIHTTCKDADTISTSEQLFFRRGQLDILKWILNWENTTNAVYTELTSEQP